MATFNRVILLGNLTRDPELRYLSGRKAVIEIGLAVNDRYKKDDEWVDTVTFVDVTFFGRTAEVINEYLAKGSPILVEGKLRLDQWQKDGENRQKLKVIGERMQMLGNRPDGAKAEQEPEPAGVGADADIPY